MVLRVIYRGNAEAVRSHDKTKQHSLAQLAVKLNEAVPFATQQQKKAKESATAMQLSRQVRLYLLQQDLGGLQAYPSLSVTHYFEVLGLPLETQRALLDRAQKEGLDARDLRLLGHPSGAGAAASAAPTEAHVRGEIDRALDDLGRISDERSGLAADLLAVGAPADAVQKLTDALRTVQDQVFSLRDLLGAEKQNKKKGAARPGQTA
ncbi:MAG: hypothetical protein QM765_30725 [Myxococcales bacterium]